MLKHGPGNGQGVNAGTILFAEPRVENLLYNIKIGFHGTPEKGYT
jgi:hypothetical protein